MPFVDFVCDNPECSIEKVEEFFHMSDDYKLKCPECKKAMRMKFSATPFYFGFTPGHSVSTGQYFDTQKQKNDFLAANNLEIMT
jgi:predicted nucleic acid-binding Zn ribbon protein